MNKTFEEKLRTLASELMKKGDPSHDMMHIDRVVSNCKIIAKSYPEADIDILISAAYLHDIISFPKNSDENAQASKYAADYARQLMHDIPEFPDTKIDQLAHVIEAHSYSAQIEAKSIEAAILQDADRLDALGATGIARCFIVGGKFASYICHPQDPNPMVNQRVLDDKKYIVDHFYKKLLRLEQKMNTGAAKEIASKRVQFMQDFLTQFYEEITPGEPVCD